MKWLKRLLIAAVSTAAVCGALAGAAWFLYPFLSWKYDCLSSPAYLTVDETQYGFASLSSKQQEDYRAVYTALSDRFSEDETVSDGKETILGTSVALPHPLSGDEAAAVYKALINDIPMLFYLNNSLWYQGVDFPGLSGNVVYMIVGYRMDAKTRATAKAEIKQAAAELLCDLPADEYDRELLLHDRLINACTYDTEAAKDGNEKDPAYLSRYTLYGALAEKKAVCAGYAKAYQYLCTCAGLYARSVTGTDQKNGIAHMWNEVTVLGAVGYVDTTWDDSEDRLTHRYFNLTAEEMAKTHTWDAARYPAPALPSAENYYVHEGLYLDVANEEKIVALTAKALREGRIAELRFAETAYAKARQYMESGTPFGLAVNRLSGKTVIRDRYYTFSDDDTCVEIVFLEQKNS